MAKRSWILCRSMAWISVVLAVGCPLAEGRQYKSQVQLPLTVAEKPEGSSVGESDQAPCIEFDEVTFNFGRMYQHEEVSHVFLFRNTGNATLKIEKVRSTCGCTAALPQKREIAPGEEGAIKTTFRSGSMRNRVVKHIYVDSNDPACPRVTLTVTGEIEVEVEVSPRGLYIGQLKVGETLERSVEMLPVGVKKFKIIEVSANHPALQVAEAVPLTGKTGGYRLKIRFGPVEQPGRISAKVTVRTDLEHSKELSIPVYGKVVEQEDSAKATTPK